jgi:hypothetical protein
MSNDEALGPNARSLHQTVRFRHSDFVVDSSFVISEEARLLQKPGFYGRAHVGSYF